MMPGHVVVYDDKLWVFARANHVTASYAGGPSHAAYGLQPLGGGDTVYVQDPPKGAIKLLPGCSGCDACPGWRCQPKCKVGTEGRKS